MTLVLSILTITLGFSAVATAQAPALPPTALEFDK
jgi:hypothetical protein